MKTILKGKPNPRRRFVLSVSPQEEDHAALQQRLTESIWCVDAAACLSSAQTILSARNVGVVLCERDLRPGSWVDLLRALVDVQHAPPLIVTSRVADDQLWAEALNLGAYDVLAKPFEQEELLRTLNLAWLRWFHGQEAPATMRAVPALKAG